MDTSPTHPYHQILAVTACLRATDPVPIVGDTTSDLLVITPISRALEGIILSGQPNLDL